MGCIVYPMVQYRRTWLQNWLHVKFLRNRGWLGRYPAGRRVAAPTGRPGGRMGATWARRSAGRAGGSEMQALGFRFAPAPWLKDLHDAIARTGSPCWRPRTRSSEQRPPLILLVAIVVPAYFFFLKPQQRKAPAARPSGGAGNEVGDEVQTIGGVIGTILEIHGDRYTLLTGNTEADGNLDGPQPTRIVFVRQAIARKVERLVDVDDDDDAEVDDDTRITRSQDGRAGADAGDARRPDSSHDEPSRIPILRIGDDHEHDDEETRRHKRRESRLVPGPISASGATCSSASSQS